MIDVFKVGKEFCPAYLSEGYVPTRRGARWQGGLCKSLGLRGAPTTAGLAKLLVHSNSRNYGRNGDCAAIHLTWTAPKSVSIAALVGGDARLLDAHEEAVQIALGFALRHTTCRVTQKRRTSNVPVQEVAMMVCHRTHSRADDPNLHTLVTILNAADVGDGVLRALDVRHFFERQRALGKVYRAELRRLVAGLGYAVLERGDGLWDLEEVTPSICAVFSTRRDQIIESVARLTGKLPRELSKPGERSFVRITGRRKEEPAKFEVMLENWKERLAAAERGLEPSMMLATPMAPTVDRMSPKMRRARIAQCVQALIESHQALRKHGCFGVALVDVIGLAMQTSPAVCLEDMEQGVQALLGQGNYVVGAHPKVLYLRSEQAVVRGRGTLANEAGNGAPGAELLSAYIKVGMTPAERARAERFLLNRGHESFGAWLRAEFADVPPMRRTAREDTCQRSVKRTTALKARVSPTLQARLANWGGANLADSLRALLCGLRPSQGVTRAQGPGVVPMEFVGPTQPASQWVKVALDRHEVLKAKRVIKASGSRHFREFLERQFRDAAPEPQPEPVRPRGAGARSHSLKARVTPSFLVALEEWAVGGLGPSLRALVLNEANRERESVAGLADVR